MLKHGKSYLVTEKNGVANIYRDGKLAGTFPETGFEVQIPGICTALAGTELAAHALAEVYKDVNPSSRRWVLTEAEYDEHIQILKNHNERLLAAYPYTEEEAESVAQHNAHYQDITEKGRQSIKAKLLNENPFKFFANWEKNPVPRPKEFPVAQVDEPTQHIRKR